MTQVTNKQGYVKRWLTKQRYVKRCKIQQAENPVKPEIYLIVIAVCETSTQDAGSYVIICLQLSFNKHLWSLHLWGFQQGGSEANSTAASPWKSSEHSYLGKNPNPWQSSVHFHFCKRPRENLIGGEDERIQSERLIIRDFCEFDTYMH